MKIKQKILILTCVGLVGCEKNESALLPRPSEKQLLQLYVIKGPQKSSGPNSLELPDENFFRDSIPMRIQRIQVASLEEAQEKLRVLNARPVDLLFLEPGFPQDAWKQTRMPKVEGRLVVAWQSAEQRADWLNIEVDWSGVLSFLRSLPLLKKGCEISPSGFATAFQKLCPQSGPQRIDFGTSEDAFLKVSLRWKEFMPELIALKKQGSAVGSHLVIDTRSNRMGVQPGDAMRASADREVFIRQYKEWSLKSL